MHRNDTMKHASNFCFRDKFLPSFYVSGTILANEIFFKEYLLSVVLFIIKEFDAFGLWMYGSFFNSNWQQIAYINNICSVL